MPAPIAWTGTFTPWIHCAGDEPRRFPWSLPGRRLSHWLLVTSLDGEEQLVVEDRAVAIPRGGSYLIQPGRLADLGSSRGNTPVWVHFDLVFHPHRTSHPHVGSGHRSLGRRAAWLQPDAQAVFGVDLPVRIPAPQEALFRAGVPRLVRRWRQGQPADAAAAAQQLAGLLLDWVAHIQAGAVIDPAVRIVRAEDSARIQLGTGIGIPAMAAAAGLGRSAFCALYRQQRGRSPGSFLRRERLDQAAALLARGDLGVGAVAALVGYGDTTAFIRAYRAAFGCTPGAGRRRSKPSG
jgi:AraC-like DNA-binding protein